MPYKHIHNLELILWFNKYQTLSRFSELHIRTFLKLVLKVKYTTTIHNRLGLTKTHFTTMLRAHLKPTITCYPSNMHPFSLHLLWAETLIANHHSNPLPDPVNQSPHEQETSSLQLPFVVMYLWSVCLWWWVKIRGDVCVSGWPKWMVGWWFATLLDQCWFILDLLEVFVACIESRLVWEEITDHCRLHMVWCLEISMGRN